MATDTTDDQDQQKKKAFQPPVQQGRPLPEAFTGDVGGGVSGLPQQAPGAATASPLAPITQAMGRPLPTQPVPQSPAGIAAQNELSRLTVRPQKGAMVPTGHDIIDYYGNERPITEPAKDQTRPGWEQIHNPILKTLAGIGNVASTFFPAASMVIPGTTAHHNLLVREAHMAADEQEKARAQDIAARGEAVGEDEKRAQIEHLGAETEHLRNPPVEKDKFGTPILTPEGYVVPNERTSTATALMGPGGKQVQGAEKPTKESIDSMYADAVDDAMTNGRDPATDPKVMQLANAKKALLKEGSEGAHIIDREVGGKPHNVMVNNKGQDIADLGEKGEKPGAENAGTWSITEDTQGHPMLFNSKTGQTKPAPGIQKAGTAARTTEPVRVARDYAHEYMGSGNFTGPGDEALMEKFFEIAKPSTGFRMSQPQINMLQNARSWMQSIKGMAYHAATGRWFPDQQRKEIVDTMETLAKIKLGEGGGGATAPSASAGGAGKTVSIDELVKRHSGGGGGGR